MYDTISMCLYPCSERKGLLKISRVRLPNNERGNNDRKKFDLHQGGKGCVIWLFIKIETEAFNASGQVPAATIEQAIPFQSHLCWVSQEFFKSQFESAQPNEDLRKLTEERLTRFKTFYDAHQEKNWISKRVSAPNANSVRIWSIARIYSKLLYD